MLEVFNDITIVHDRMIARAGLVKDDGQITMSDMQNTSPKWRTQNNDVWSSSGPEISFDPTNNSSLPYLSEFPHYRQVRAR
jgi:hypothetical protein